MFDDDSDRPKARTTRSRLWVAMIAIAFSISCRGAQIEAEAEAEPEPSQAAPEHGLRGVWSVTDQSGSGDLPGLFIFTDRHYSAIYAIGEGPRPSSATAFAPTAEEMAAQYASIIVNTGTYEADASEITMRPMLAKSPEFVGGHSTMDYAIDGDVLSLTSTSIVAANGDAPPEGAAETMTLRRIE